MNIKKMTCREFLEALGGNGSVLGFQPEAETSAIAINDEFKPFQKVKVIEHELENFKVLSIGKDESSPTHVLTNTCFEDSLNWIPLEIFYSQNKVYLTPIKTWDKVQEEVTDLLLF